MLKQFLETGEIVSTHGIKGEVRFYPWCDSPEFMTRFETLYFDSDGKLPVTVEGCRPHGNIVILKLKGTDSVEQAQKLRGKILYMNRADSGVAKDEWFVQDLIGCRVLDADNTSICYGKLCDVSATGANDVWYIDGTDGREYIIPAIKDVVIKVEAENETVYIRPLKGIFSEELTGDGKNED